MIAAGLVAFREGLEAALIVSIVMSYLEKSGQSAKKRYAWIGVGLALVVSFAIAIGIQIVGTELEGTEERIFEGVTMFLAVAILTWMVFWMRYQSRALQSMVERDIQGAIGAGQRGGLVGVTFFAVFREGVETALLLSAAALVTNQFDTLVGSLVGLVIAAVVGYVLYDATVRLNLQAFFNVTSLLLLIFAAGLFALGIHEFQEAGILPTFNEHVYDISAVLPEDSFIGELLHTIVGYSSAPSLLQTVGYIVYFLFALIGIPWLVNRRIERSGRGMAATT